MSQAERLTALLARFEASRLAAIQALHSVDPRRVAHPYSGWTVADLIAHLTIWEAAGLEAIRSGLVGDSFEMPGLREAPSLDAFNQIALLPKREQPVDYLMMEWRDLRKSLLRLLRDLPDGSLELACPDPRHPGEFTTLAAVLDDLLRHEAEHSAEFSMMKKDD